jgi:type II secretory pathway component PulF
MPLTFTPGQLRRRSEYYYQMAQMTAAGLSLVAALEQLRRTPPARDYRKHLHALLQHIQSGYTFSEAVRRLGSWTPGFDQSLLYAGEQSGRLDACFHLLADYYRDRARTAAQTLADLAYPAFLFHFAVLIFSFVRFVGSGDWLGCIWRMLSLLAPVYLVIGAGIFAVQSRRGEKWRAWMERMLDPVPVLGAARRCLALGRLSASLEGLLSAGVTIIEAWELAAAASGSPRLRRTVLGWRPLVDAGQTPAEVVGASPVFPEIFAHQYATGEISGQLDETLRRLHTYYQEEGSRKLHAFAQWTPRGIYLLVMLTIAYQIVRFYASYFQQVGAAGGF